MILPEKSSGISLSCQTLRRSPSCPLFRRSSTCSLWHFHIPTLSEHSSSIPASEKSASHGKLHGDTLSDHNPSVGITQIRYGRRSIFLSACHTSSRWLFSFLFFNIAHTYPVVKPLLSASKSIKRYCLLRSQWHRRLSSFTILHRPLFRKTDHIPAVFCKYCFQFSAVQL